MAGWDVLMSPYIYHPPEAPVVPKPDNTAAELISRGTATAVNAFLTAANQRKQAELEQERLTQQQALTLRAQDIARENNLLDYKVQQQNANSIEQSRKDFSRWHDQSLFERSEAEKARLNKGLAAADAAINWQHGIDQNDTTSIDAMKGLNPGLLRSNPGEFLVLAERWNIEHGNAKVGSVPELKKSLDERVNAITIPYVDGAEYVNAAGEGKGKPEDLMWRVPDKSGNGRWIPATSQVGQRKLLDVYHDYQDPVNQQAIKKAIIAAGHGSVIETVDPKLGKVATPTLDKWATRVLGSFEKTRETPVNQTAPQLMYTHPKWTVTADAGVSSTPTEGSAALTPDELTQDTANYKDAVAKHPDRAAQFQAIWQNLHPGEPLPETE